MHGIQIIRKSNTYQYMHIHADTGMCISHMHRAYPICTVMYVVHIHLHMCMYYFNIHTTYIDAYVVCM